MHLLREQFAQWGSKLGDDQLCALGPLGRIGDMALMPDKHIKLQNSGLPNTCVPGRNLMFLFIRPNKESSR